MLATAEPIANRLMTVDEARDITEDIRGNFDSLGKMLLDVQQRKGFLALGYKTLESYCLTEFGKGKSRLYQVIEEARIEEEIVGELSLKDSAPKSLKMPGTYLRTLRDLPSPQQKVAAIKYANLLASQEGKKRATKLHLQVAALEIGGQKTEQTRKCIEEMGFLKGTEVEIIEGFAKHERGIIKRVDKEGQIHVEHYNGNSMPVAWGISNLKIVPPTDRPQFPTSIDTVEIGDTVRIFSSNKNNGKTGEIVARLNDKQASVKIEGNECKIEIPYAELERIDTAKKSQPQAKTSIWNADWNPSSKWHYNATTNTIYSFQCSDLSFHPPAECPNPSEWLEDWRNKHGSSLADAILTPDDIATLVIAAAIKMSDGEKQKFLSKINILVKGTPENASPDTAEPDKERETEIERLVSDRDSLLIRLAEEQARYLKVEENDIQPLRDKIQDLYSELGIAEKELRNVKKELKITLEYTKSGYFQQEILRLSTQLTKANAVIEELPSSTESLIEGIDSKDCLQWNECEDADGTLDYYYHEDNEAKVYQTKALSISFGMTVEELISGKKTQTRRVWNDGYASHFIRYFEEGTAIPALNKGRYRGGHELGSVRLTQRPYQQLLSEMTAQDLLEEGGMVSTTQDFIDTFFLGQDKLVWVLHFEFCGLENAPKNPTPGDTAAPVGSPVENTPAPPIPAEVITSTGAEESWFSLLETNNFSRIDESYFSEEEPTEVYRGWGIYIHNMAVADIFHPDKGAFCIDLSFYADTEKQIIRPVEWLKTIINRVEDFCPGQLPLQLGYAENSTVDQETITDEPNPNWQKDWLDKNLPIRPEIGHSTTQGCLTEKIANYLDNLLCKADALVRRLNSKKIKRADWIKVEKEIRLTNSLIKNLELFSSLQIGMTVNDQRNTGKIGIITNLTLSTGGMPEAWVKWEEKSVEVPEKLSFISVRDEKEEES